MDSKVFEHLMAMLSAHAQAISALYAVHPRPDEVRTALARLVEKANLDFDTEGQLLYRESLQTFERALPPH